MHKLHKHTHTHVDICTSIFVRPDALSSPHSAAWTTHTFKLINNSDCSSSAKGSHFCLAPALCEWRKSEKKRSRASFSVVAVQRGAVLSTEADGCTACDQPPLDRAHCAVVTFPFAPHPSCIQSSVSGCYTQFFYSQYCVWTELQPAPQLSRRSPTRNVNNLPIYSTGRADADPPGLWFIHKHSRLLKKKKKKKSGFFKMFVPVSKSSSLAPIPTPRVALKTD